MGELAPRLPSGLTWSELRSSAIVFDMPLAVKFRGVTSRRGVLIQGPQGWGEFAPFVDYPPVAAQWWLAAALEAAWCGWPKAMRSEVGVNAIIPVLPAVAAAERAAAAQQAGYRTLKVKVAESPGSLPADRERLLAIRSEFTGAVRIDANAGWDVAAAIEAITVLDRAVGGLDYVEQPCATLEQLAQVRKATGVRIAADESIRRAQDAVGAVQQAAADVLVFKAAPLGGVRRCLQLAELTNIPIVVSSAMDTSIGLAAGTHLAGCVRNSAGDNGLGTGALVADDLIDAPTLPTQGRLPVPDQAPGPAAAALARARARVTADQREFWLDRLGRCWQQLQLTAGV